MVAGVPETALIWPGRAFNKERIIELMQTEREAMCAHFSRKKKPR